MPVATGCHISTISPHSSQFHVIGSQLLAPTRISGKAADLEARLSFEQTHKADGLAYHRLRGEAPLEGGA